MNSCLKSVIIFIFFTINWAVFSQEILSTDNTEDWISYAKIIESYMNKNVDPCDNFYEYACGNYKNVVPMFQGKHIQGVQEQLNYEIDDQIGTLLEEEETDDELVEESKKFENKEWKLFSKVKGQVRDTKRFYKSCKNSEIFQLKKSEEYLNYIKNELGGWPAIDSNWTETDYDWFKVNVKINRFGAGPFYVNETDHDSDRDICFQRYFGFENQTDFNKMNKQYQYNMKMMLKLMKMYEIPEDKAQEIANEIMQFGFEYNQNYNNKEGTENEYPFIPTYVQHRPRIASGMFTQMFINNCGRRFYIDNLSFLMKTANKRIVANYMVLYFLYLLHKPELTFSKDETSKQICTRITRDLLAPVVDMMFVNSKYYDSELTILEKAPNVQPSPIYKDFASWYDWYIRYNSFIDESYPRQFQIIKALKLVNDEYYKYVETGHEYFSYNVKWLSSEGIIFAYLWRKHLRINYGDDHMNLNNIGIKQNSNYFKNLLEVLALKRSETNRYKFPTENVKVYTDKRNLYLSFGVLSKPIFNKNYPHAYNFGGFGGYLIGHELQHAYDLFDRCYEYNGTQTMYKISNTEMFYELINCFKRQYLNYPKNNLPNILENTLSDENLKENIYDSVGLRQGYRGYKKWLEEKGNSEIEQIPELNMNGKQLYFLAFAHINCKYEINDDNVIPILPGKSDKHHSPTEYRVISSISNMEEFSREFNCPKGSRMNPEDKCFLW